MIKAGLKGKPSDYYKLIKEHKLSGNEIKELLLSKKLRGKTFIYGWSLSISSKGECEYTRIYGEKLKKTDKGKYWINGDELWFQFESLYEGLKYSAEVYKNPEGSKNELSEYLYLTDFWLFPFSIVE